MTSHLKSLIRQLFYRSGTFQNLVGFFSVLSGRTRGMGISHLASYRENDAIGPLQRDEAIALFGIIRSLRPKVVVEFGFFHGHSAFNFLQALSGDARLFSYDIDPESIRRAKSEFGFDRRFTFIAKSQTEFDAADVGRREIDFVFFDAAHELDLNQETFRRIAPHLAPEGMMAVHDTGLWPREYFESIHHEFERGMPGEWVTENLYAHQPGERRFIDWILSEYPEFSAIHFHSTATLRHGFSLLQRRRSLSQG
ncbi:class I SAM-dependent methyltransferase [Luteolibacter yonseiensis]|uniref:Class I SAM-dependent methyltransferase n=1 Tax=Luteolibacter yonseiensis TaxID=1144680 RepID=A0A934VA26_9BACT|nr:CmcI family methyltransferase [Luteolibacter yonseiensis]MBK1814416.1 class I SAM-dependent methyltransferase [Luteolibacter yonseiensis]